MPVYGHHQQNATLDNVIGIHGNFPVSIDGDTIYDAFPVTFDYTQSAFSAQSGALTEANLHDISSGNEWRLRRIVGKLHVNGWHEGGEGNAKGWPAWEVAAGYIVLKTDEEGDATTNFDETNPLAQESAEDPWIWRRKWVINILGDFAVNSPAATDPEYGSWVAGRGWPANTAGYGSVLDGPHIDQKTNRRIGRTERLYFMIAAVPWNPANFQLNVEFSGAHRIAYSLDNRLFGNLLTGNRGNRGNASR